MGEDGSKGQWGELRLTERDRKKEGGKKRGEIASGGGSEDSFLQTGEEI